LITILVAIFITVTSATATASTALTRWLIGINVACWRSCCNSFNFFYTVLRRSFWPRLLRALPLLRPVATLCGIHVVAVAIVAVTVTTATIAITVSIVVACFTLISVFRFFFNFHFTFATQPFFNTA
jgi:hypothetical protein